MTNKNEKVYLGDGLYLKDEGFQFKLYTQTGSEVYLDDRTLRTFLDVVEQKRKVKITITPVEDVK